MDLVCKGGQLAIPKVELGKTSLSLPQSLSSNDSLGYCYSFAYFILQYLVNWPDNHLNI